MPWTRLSTAGRADLTKEVTVLPRVSGRCWPGLFIDVGASAASTESASPPEMREAGMRDAAMRQACAPDTAHGSPALDISRARTRRPTLRVTLRGARCAAPDSRGTGHVRRWLGAPGPEAPGSDGTGLVRTWAPAAAAWARMAPIRQPAGPRAHSGSPRCDISHRYRRFPRPIHPVVAAAANLARCFAASAVSRRAQPGRAPWSRNRLLDGERPQPGKGPMLRYPHCPR